ncbi:mtDNA inheritance, partitioning of the mitochondrial organelle [Coemansia helicoidea]|uniref:MtDNA inheritance, partitioning of the mitochondrial organelle n=1 Tax=Coemansia helicoidea TaxID=1286919 RepID=A0ACC1LEX3_9FUNG|nr:mtDNA inheritance, partitioning of the mitochondrial organelle [Coemansia helicoidea]
MREVITLQFGERANYVGAHFWNLQLGCRGDDDRVGELFSERRERPAGAAAVPRALVFDAPGNFGSLGRAALQSAGSDEDDKEQAAWGGAAEVHRQELHEAGDGARCWADVGQARFASHALGAVTGVEFGNSLGGMGTFQEGAQVFAGLDARDDVLEGGLRVFAEECDRLQGFHVLCDAFGGFAGFGAGFMARVRDEFPKAPVLLYSVGDTQRAGQLRGAQLMDAAVAAATAADTASMRVPLFAPAELAKLSPRVQVADADFEQLSAYLAANAAQWSASLAGGRRVLDEIVNQVTQQGHYTTAESLLAPGLHIPDGASGADAIVARAFAGCSDASVHSLSSATGLLVVDRGTHMSDVVAPTHPAAAYVAAAGALELPRAFPRVFRGVNARGDPEATPAERIPVAGVLCSTPASLGHLQHLRSALQARSGRHFKDYERETLGELAAALDVAVDRYSSSD